MTDSPDQPSGTPDSPHVPGAAEPPSASGGAESPHVSGGTEQLNVSGAAESPSVSGAAGSSYVPGPSEAQSVSGSPYEPGAGEPPYVPGVAGAPYGADSPYGAGAPESPYVPDEVVAQDGVGVPDPFMRLWTPHRMAYIEGENKPTSSEAGSGCPFCRLPGLPDADALIVHRGEAAYAVLNLYPYNPGHLMVVPYRHVADYTELTEVEVADVAALTRQAMVSIRTVSGAHGFNIGMNQGEIAGAGIAAHLHQHVVPRWSGDTNFMPAIAHTKVLPQLLPDTRALLAKSWPTEP